MESHRAIRVEVWDWPVRIIHWAMVIALLTLFISINQSWMQVHFYAGYSLSALLLFRLIWLVAGTRYARLSGFNLSLSGFFRQLKELASGQAPSFSGHNPAGAIMVLALWSVLLLQVASGMLYTDDIFWFGPFFFAAPAWLQDIAAWLHPRLPPLILLLVTTHILAVLYHKVRFREALTSAMFHGQKEAMSLDDAREPVSKLWLILSLIAALGWLFWLLTLEI